jgi:hypothetical protein
MPDCQQAGHRKQVKRQTLPAAFVLGLGHWKTFEGPACYFV